MIKIPTEEPRLKGEICDYDEVFHGAATTDVFEFIVLAAQQWFLSIIHSLMKDNLSDETRKLASVAEAQGLSHFKALLFNRVAGSAMRKAGGGTFLDNVTKAVPELQQRIWQHGTWGRPEANHHEIVYDLVCGILKLDVRIAREKGLRLMVDMGTHKSPPRLGMSRLNFASQDEGTPTSNLRAASLWESHHEEGGLFETVKVDIGEEMPIYRVIGCGYRWLPRPMRISMARKRFLSSDLFVAIVGQHSTPSDSPSFAVVSIRCSSCKDDQWEG